MTIESYLNFALWSQDSNDLDRVRKNSHELTPQSIKELIEALKESFETIEDKDDEIAGLREGFETVEEIAESIDDNIETIKKSLSVLVVKSKDLQQSAKKIAETINETLEALKESMNDLNQVIEEQADS